MPATLQTERLQLRQFAEADLDGLASIYADPEVMRHLGDGHAVGRADSWRAIAGMLGHWRLRGYGMYAVEERVTGALLGRVGLLNPEGWPGLEVGWTLGRQHWGRGYATEAATAVLDQTFGRLRVPRVISLIYAENAPSIRLAERLGERLMRETAMHGRRVLVYGIDRVDWPARRPRLSRS